MLRTAGLAGGWFSASPPLELAAFLVARHSPHSPQQLSRMELTGKKNHSPVSPLCGASAHPTPATGQQQLFVPGRASEVKAWLTETSDSPKSPDQFVKGKHKLLKQRLFHAKLPGTSREGFHASLPASRGLLSSRFPAASSFTF